MDFASLSIAGISIIVLVPGVIEFVKTALKLQDGAAEVLSVIVGAAMVGLAYAMQQQMFPAQIAPIVELVVVMLAGGLSIPGYYKLVSQAGRGAIAFAAEARARACESSAMLHEHRVSRDPGFAVVAPAQSAPGQDQQGVRGLDFRARRNSSVRYPGDAPPELFRAQPVQVYRQRTTGRDDPPGGDFAQQRKTVVMTPCLELKPETLIAIGEF